MDVSSVNTYVGIIGIVLGGAMSAVPGLITARRAEHRLQTSEHESREAQLRLAPRLVALQLDEASQLLVGVAVGVVNRRSVLQH
jgi:hypothetical protein